MVPRMRAPSSGSPRSRGVYQTSPCSEGGHSGSSPLARGLRVPPACGWVRGGIIPARAGFTRGDHGDRMAGGDHPRSRGVYEIAFTNGSRILGSSPLARGLQEANAALVAVRGSSPLARGLRTPRRPATARARIIPARAGFTVNNHVVHVHCGDHPRSRGVYSVFLSRPRASSGSSPLARGLRPFVGDAPFWEGIIPARAGFTPLWSCPRRWRTDHPRSRGVYRDGGADERRLAGSSPLARGLLYGDSNIPVTYGIIPARAGFTAHWLHTALSSADHPRSRGVYAELGAKSVATEGSSPLARGLQEADLDSGPYGGIIPARAGFTLLAQIGERASTDHPRSRGVYPSPAPTGTGL